MTFTRRILVQWVLAGMVAAGTVFCGCAPEASPPGAYTPNAYAVEQNSAALDAMRAGDLETALERANAAVGDDPDFREAWCNKANILGQLGRFDEAAAILENVTRRWPEFAQALVFQGIYLERLGRTNAADACYNRAADLFAAETENENAPPEIIMCLAVAEFLARGKVAGLRVINELLNTFPNYTAAHLVRRRIAEGDRDFFMRWTLETAQAGNTKREAEEAQRKE